MVLKPFRIVFLFFILFSSVSSFADDLDQAQLLEREGDTEGARDLYVQWLEASAHDNKDNFGRILIHTLRISGSIDDDLSLINTYLKHVSLKEDRIALVKTAVVLSELTGKSRERDKYLAMLDSYRAELSVSDKSALMRIIIQRSISTENLSDLSSAAVVENKDLFIKHLVALKDDSLISWLESVHKKQPSILKEPDWLFLVHEQLSSAGMDDMAFRYKEKLYHDFPSSVEASILKGEISIIPEPSLLMNDAEAITVIETGGAEKESGDDFLYIQAGAFQNYNNALQMKEELDLHSLDCRIVNDKSVYKVIIITSDPDSTDRVLAELGIRGFRIPRIP